MTTAEIEARLAEARAELALLIEQANKEIAYRRGFIAALEMLLQPAAATEEQG